MKIPPPPLCQRGVRGDFHINVDTELFLWQQILQIQDCRILTGKTARLVGEIPEKAQAV